MQPTMPADVPVLQLSINSTKEDADCPRVAGDAGRAADLPDPALVSAQDSNA